MTNAMQILTYNGTPIRTTKIEGELWWVAKDVCDVLEIKNSRDAVSSLENDEKGVGTADTLGGSQEVQIVNESGIYNLIFKSRTNAALAFRRWVTHEILPQIRKQGFYLNPNASIEVRQLRALEFRVEALRLKIESKELEGRARLLVDLEDSIPIIEWIRENLPELENKQVANLTRSIKRAITHQLQRPVGVTHENGGKVMAATLIDIEAAVELLKEHRPELILEQD